ncbi:hypothetical protein L484_016514 [Morus notabilis]|uniref:Uncharacterized protein n=1 Tax=Morus notabilis TaxID=981085 RepID=W9QNR7_9ROSA|nr:hypothetical protein L484_016514 [Morus notabilis]
MAPDLGHNECAALEDAVVLGQHIGDLVLNKRHVVGESTCLAFEKSAEKRRWRTVGMVVLSTFLCGFVEQSGCGFFYGVLKEDYGV